MRGEDKWDESTIPLSDKLNAKIMEPNLMIDLKSSSSDVSIMKVLGLLFIDLCVLVRVVT